MVDRRVRGVGDRRVRRQGPRGVCQGATRGGMEAWVVRTGRPSAVYLTHEPLHLFQGVAQHEDVVSREEQRGDLGEFTHGGSVGIGHHLAQPVHGDVEVVHALPLAAVDLQAHGLQLVLGEEFAVFLVLHLQQDCVFFLSGHGLSEFPAEVGRRVALCG